ncbi:YdgH/BhsA/McbA-like domain containing protein [uncultured Gilliamella sp.]|uniref:YdgH/BhsA/McbA-like domain containing protein n=1 Tax=uncultured Gilliamella sp. TaxID=1193505 RepID=UPI0025E6ABE0|nr:YdgH/BhsA/McbA-like domain containing protein [uncultured Gilliamella sp.]
MKRFNKSSLTLAVLLSLPIANLYAAESLSAIESNHLVPMKEIFVTGNYLQAENAANDISRVADEAGAKYYHIKAIENATAGDSADRAIVYADIYQSNAPIAVKKDEVTYNGVVGYERCKALYYLPFEIVKFKGNYNNTAEITNSASKLAKERDAYAFYIYSIAPDNAKNQTQDIEVALYKKEAPIRDYIVKTDLTDQDAYEISSDAFKVMKPYETIVFHGVFNNTTDISAAAQKHAIANNAHFYYVKEVSANPASTVQTVFVNLYK